MDLLTTCLDDFIFMSDANNVNLIMSQLNYLY